MDLAARSIVPMTEWQGRTKAGSYGDFVAQGDHHAGEVLGALDKNGYSSAAFDRYFYRRQRT